LGCAARQVCFKVADETAVGGLVEPSQFGEELADGLATISALTCSSHRSFSRRATIDLHLSILTRASFTVILFSRIHLG
jgi:hypothetical protein